MMKSISRLMLLGCVAISFVLVDHVAASSSKGTKTQTLAPTQTPGPTKTPIEAQHPPFNLGTHLIPLGRFELAVGSQYRQTTEVQTYSEQSTFTKIRQSYWTGTIKDYENETQTKDLRGSVALGRALTDFLSVSLSTTYLSSKKSVDRRQVTKSVSSQSAGESITVESKGLTETSDSEQYSGFENIAFDARTILEKEWLRTYLDFGVSAPLGTYQPKLTLFDPHQREAWAFQPKLSFGPAQKMKLPFGLGVKYRILGERNWDFLDYDYRVRVRGGNILTFFVFVEAPSAPLHPAFLVGYEVPRASSYALARKGESNFGASQTVNGKNLLRQTLSAEVPFFSDAVLLPQFTHSHLVNKQRNERYTKSYSDYELQLVYRQEL